MSLGPRTPTKNLTHWVDLLGHLLSQNHFSNFSDLGLRSEDEFFFVNNLYLICLSENLKLLFYHFFVSSVVIITRIHRNCFHLISKFRKLYIFGLKMKKYFINLIL